MVDVYDNGVMDALGALDGFMGEVDTDRHIGAYVEGLHYYLSVMFDNQMDAVARVQPDNFWHVYESNGIGSPGLRLWDHTLSGRGRNRVANVNFKASRVPVPVDEALTRAGDNVKTVEEGLHVFVWKAPIVEYRLPVTITPKRGQYLVFAIGEDIIFSRGPIHTVPGNTVGGSFTAMLAKFYSGDAQSAVKRIDEQNLRGGEAPDGTLRRTTMKKFSLGTSDFNTGQARAKSLMKKKTGNYIGQAMARENIKGGEIWDG